MNATLLSKSRPLEILILAPDFKPNPGGVAEYVHQMARHLKSAGDEPVVLARPAEERNIDEYTVVDYRDKVIPYEGPPWNLFGRYMTYRKNCRARRDMLEQYSPDVVWMTAPLYDGHLYPQHYWGSACRKTGVPYIITSHGSDSRRLASEGAGSHAKKLVKDAERLLVVSSFVRDNLAKARLETGHATVLPNGVSLDCLEKSGYGGILPYGVDEGFMVLCATRFVGCKRLDILVRGMKTVIKQFPSAVLVLAGDGEERDDIRRVTEELGLKNHVRFPGYVAGPEKWACFERADVYAMPSEGEGFGISFVEAAAKGTPCVATWGDGSEEAVLHEETGLLVPPNEPDALAEAIIRLLKDDDLRERLGRAGRRRVEEELNWPAIARKVHGILEDVVR